MKSRKMSSSNILPGDKHLRLKRDSVRRNEGQRVENRQRNKWLRMGEKKKDSRGKQREVSEKQVHSVKTIM